MRQFSQRIAYVLSRVSPLSPLALLLIDSLGMNPSQRQACYVSAPILACIKPFLLNSEFTACCLHPRPGKFFHTVSSLFVLKAAFKHRSAFILFVSYCLKRPFLLGATRFQVAALFPLGTPADCSVRALQWIHEVYNDNTDVFW